MPRIHVLVHPHTRCQWMPLAMSRRLLRQAGYRVEFRYGVTPDLFDCDALWVSHVADVGDGSHRRRNSRLPIGVNVPVMQEFLSSDRAAATRVIYDDARWGLCPDSFALLPDVTRYLRRQYRKDRSSYYTPVGTGHDHTNFFYKLQGRPLPDPSPVAPLDPAQEHKLGFSWNLGCHIGFYAPNYRLLPFLMRQKLSRVLNGVFFWQLADLLRVNWQILRGRVPRRRFRDPRAPRHWNLVGLYTIQPIDSMYQRTLAMPILEQLRARDPNVLQGDVLTTPSYLRAVSESKLVLSLFGHGEPCYREFEAMVGGSCVIMPDMSHLETWPPETYRPHETYWPIEWDLSNLEATVDEALRDDEKRLAIAEGGYQHMRAFWSDAGRERFIAHVIDIVDTAIAAPLR